MNKFEISKDILPILTVIGSLIIALLTIISTFLFKRHDLFIAKKQSKKIELKKYHQPLLRCLIELDHRIGKIISVLDQNWLSEKHIQDIKELKGFSEDPLRTGYFAISSIYHFSAFFGWIETIKNSIGAVNTKAKNIDIYKLDPAVSMVSKMFQFKEAFDDFKSAHNLKDCMDSCKLHKQFQYSIGEMMVNKGKDEIHSIKSFREFFTLYKTDLDFRFWLIPLEELIIGLADFPSNSTVEEKVISTKDMRPLRLIAIRYWIRIIMKEISKQLNLKTPSPDEVIKNLSSNLQNNIKGLKFSKNLDSYFGSI